MPEVLGAVIGAIAVICIPLVGWFSQRATREGRLLLRLQRLGEAYALMPDTAERDVFKIHLTDAIVDLNTWLDPINASRRRVIRRISAWTYAVGVLAVLIVIPSIDQVAIPWLSPILGVAIGALISTVRIVSSAILERRADSRAGRIAQERESAAAADRMDALRQGRPLPAPTR